MAEAPEAALAVRADVVKLSPTPSRPSVVLGNPKVVVLSGGPGVGKTTLVEALKGRGYPVLPEPAFVVMEAITGLLEDGHGAGASEQLAWRKQHKSAFVYLLDRVALAQEARAVVRFRDAACVFLDRSALDSIPYARSRGYDAPAILDDEAVATCIGRIDQVYVLRGVEFDVEKRNRETGRATDPAESAALSEAIYSYYKEEAQCATEWLPPTSVEERAAHVLRGAGLAPEASPPAQGAVAAPLTAISSPAPTRLAAAGSRPKVVVLSGGPGVGKTTLVEALKGRGYPVLPEPAFVVMEAITGLLEDGHGAGASEQLAWRKQHKSAFVYLLDRVALAQEARAVVRFRDAACVFLDRSALDSIPYARSRGYDAPAILDDEAVATCIGRIDQVYVLRGVEFDVEKRNRETGRATDPAESAALSEAIYSYYKEEAQCATEWLPPTSVEERAAHVLRGAGLV